MSRAARRPRLPGAIELPWARRRRLRAERPTQVLGLLAVTLTAVVAAGEVRRAARRAPERLPPGAAARQTVEVAVEGYRGAAPLEARLLNLLGAFTLTFGVVRASTWIIRTRGRLGPFRNMVVGSRHVHHFVPGIVLSLLSGGAAVLTEDGDVEAWLAVPFGAGAALTLDEWALLLRLDDVYWSREGIVSVQVSFLALAILSGTVLATRAMRRGERRLGAQAAAGAATDSAPARVQIT